jgi:hypothetical protein
MSADLNAIKEKTGGIVFVDGKERKIHLYDLNGEPTGTQAFGEEEDYDEVIKEVSDTYLELYRLDPKPEKLLAVLTPEGVTPDEKLLNHVIEILEKHGLEPDAYPSDVRGFLGFPPSTSQPRKERMASAVKGFAATVPQISELVMRAPTAVTEDERDERRKKLEMQLEELDRIMQFLAMDIVSLEGDEKRVPEHRLKYLAFLGYNRIQNRMTNELGLINMLDRLEAKKAEEKLKTIQGLMNNLSEQAIVRIFEVIKVDPDDPEAFVETLRRFVTVKE